MYVQVENVALFFEITNKYGLPEARSQHDDELFGAYHVGDRRAFLRFSPVYKTWDVLVDPIAEEEDDDAPISDEEVEASIIACLEDGPRPALPFDMTKRVQEDTFVFVGARYAWTFLPELRRWTVAPIGRD